MGEHDQHRKRVYNRFLREGLMGFEEHNAMEFLLFLAHARGDTNSLAHRVIRTFGSLSAALDAPYEELIKVPGIGPSSAAVLKFIPQMCAYYLENKRDARQPLNSPAAAAEFLMPYFFAKTAEEFYVAALDDRRTLLRFERLSYGTANTTSRALAGHRRHSCAQPSARRASAIQQRPRCNQKPSAGTERSEYRAGRPLHFLRCRLPQLCRFKLYGFRERI